MNKKFENVVIETRTRAEKIAALIVASKLMDRPISEVSWNDAISLNGRDPTIFPFVALGEDGPISCYASVHNKKVVLFNNLQSLFEEPTVKVTLNNEYSAEVSAMGIKVGCQKFPLSVIDELVEARKKIYDK